VSAFSLRWRHDAMRSRTAGEGGELTLRTAAATRDAEHLYRLLAEHLARIELQAAVGELELQAVDVQPFEERSDSFLPDAQRQGEALGQVLERIAARLGPQRVLRAAVLEDHRPQWMTHWQPATQEAPRVSRHSRLRPRPREAPFALPQPTFILPEPLRLALRGERPLYQGVVHLLCGPQRVEGGWWHRLPAGGEFADGACAQTAGPLVPQTVVRDYWVGWSERAGVLWLFSTRLAGESTAWFLHGVFA
jgi:protein ImuB